MIIASLNSFYQSITIEFASGSDYWVDNARSGPLVWINGARLTLDSTATCWQKRTLPDYLKLALKELRSARAAVGPASAAASKANAALPKPDGDDINTTDIKLRSKLETAAAKATTNVYDVAKLAREAAERFYNSVQKKVGATIKIKSIRVGKGDCLWVNAQLIETFIW